MSISRRDALRGATAAVVVTGATVAPLATPAPEAQGARMGQDGIDGPRAVWTRVRAPSLVAQGRACSVSWGPPALVRDERAFLITR